MNKLKLGYFADGKWGENTLLKFLDDRMLEIGFVVLRYNNPDPDIKKIAEESRIDCFSHPNINSKEFKEKVKDYNCDLFVSMSFDKIFKKELIELPPLKIINCHVGKLPFYRGRNAAQRPGGLRAVCLDQTRGISRRKSPHERKIIGELKIMAMGVSGRSVLRSSFPLQRRLRRIRFATGQPRLVIGH